MTEDTALVQAIKERLRVTQHLSRLNARRVVFLQAKGGAEIELSRLRLDIDHIGETPALLTALDEALRHIASIDANLETCSLQIATSETELEDLDKRVAASSGEGEQR